MTGLSVEIRVNIGQSFSSRASRKVVAVLVLASSGVACTIHKPTQPTLSPNRNAFLLCRRTGTRLQPRIRLGLLALHRVLIHALRSRKETALLRAPAHPARKSATRNPIDAATVHAWAWEPATRDPVDAAAVHSWQSATWDPIDAAAVQACAWEQHRWTSLPVSTGVAVAPSFARDGAARACDLLGEGGHVRDSICGGVLGTYAGHTRVGSFAGFGEGIVARVEVFAFLVKVR